MKLVFSDYLLFHIAAFLLGFVMDLIIGDPQWFPHPVRAIGGLISFLTKKLLKTDGERNPKKEQAGGILCVLTVLIVVTIITSVLSIGSYFIHPYLGLALEAVMTWQILAVKSLRVESMKVYKALMSGTLEDAKKAVSMIVGRDTAVLDEEGVIKAAVETVAENTSDGVIAPMLYTAIGGPVLGFIYKSINTMDSMIGYKNEKYLYFGRAAAKLDDFVNFLPSRISAGIMIFAGAVGGKSYSAGNAVRIYKRDRHNHASPNSAQTEAVCAGALGLKLAGNAFYFGKLVEKPFIGDELRSPEREDIRRVNRLMVISAVLTEILCLALMTGLWVMIHAK